jgi:hypothetical protein
LSDTVTFRDLTESLALSEVATALNGGGGSENNNSVVVCGSANDAAAGGDSAHRGFSASTATNQESNDEIALEQQRKQIWNDIILTKADQLRQKVAWALSQILVLVAAADVDAFQQTGPYIAYYDIFVCNAFGNYQDILKEVT